MQNVKKSAAITLWAAMAIGLAGAGAAEEGGMIPGGDEGFAAMFAEMDADKNGKVTPAEVDAHHAARMAAADANGDGFLSAEELAQMRIDEVSKRAAKHAAAMVDHLDSDADGLLSAAELAAGRGAPPDGAEMIAHADTDGDGAVSLEEAEDGMGRHGHKGHRRGGFWGMFGGGSH